MVKTETVAVDKVPVEDNADNLSSPIKEEDQSVGVAGAEEVMYSILIGENLDLDVQRLEFVCVVEIDKIVLLSTELYIVQLNSYIISDSYVANNHVNRTYFFSFS